MEIGIAQDFPVFRDWINLLKVAGEEHTLVCTDKGIKILSMDPSHVLMVDTNLGKTLFDSYTIKGDEEKITINVNEVAKFLDRIGKDERVRLVHNVKEARLDIHSTKAGYNRRFRLAILEPYEDEVPEPKIFFKANSRLTMKAFETAIKDAEIVAEHVKLDLNDKRVKISAIGDVGSADSEWDMGSDDLLALKAEDESVATFTLSYMSDIVKALKPLAEVVNVELSTDMPIKVVGECKKDQVEVTYYLAPCIGV